MRYLFVLLLAGCATTETVWEKPGASDQAFNMDAGMCKAQAFGVPGAMANAMQVAIVYSTCMQGKGWYTVERPIQTAAPRTSDSYQVIGAADSACKAEAEKQSPYPVDTIYKITYERCMARK